MKYKTLLTYFVLTLSFNSFAASPVWEIKGHGTKLFLAGTIHLLRASDYPLPAGFELAYKKSSIVIFETDLEALKTPQLSKKLISSVQLKPSENLFQFLTPKTQHTLKQYCLKNNININQLKNFKPSFVAINLALLELRKLQVTQIGVDEFFNKKAIKDQKKILGLETPEQQIQFLSQMGKGYENEFILQTLIDLKTINQQFDDMISSWKNGDLKKIESFFIMPTKKQFPIMHQQLLIKRNQAWLPQLKQYLKTPEIEIVMVGSAHLAGEDGLLKSLKKMGYSVTQLK